jgi:hypothetical protein
MAAAKMKLLIRFGRRRRSLGVVRLTHLGLTSRQIAYILVAGVRGANLFLGSWILTVFHTEYGPKLNARIQQIMM